MTKGELMKKVYTEKELQNIDSALPIQLWNTVDHYYHVMNYNDKGCFGELQDMREIAKERNINLEEHGSRESVN